MNYLLAPSVMCCDFFRLAEQIEALERGGADLLHVDVMDGSYVPNFALGTDFVKQLRRATKIPLDIHLMTLEPRRHLDAFGIGEGDLVSVHYETLTHHCRVLQEIKARGAKALLAINPGTPVECAVDLLDDLDGILVMTVNPGFAGQRMVPHSPAKIARARRFLDENGRPDARIEVDGNVSIENAILMRDAGADIFVGGTAAIFRGEDIAANARRFRESVF